MDIKELKSDKLSLHLSITVFAKDIEDEIGKKLAQIAKTAKVDGFRVGKVPMPTIKKRYTPSVRSDVVTKQITNAINSIQKERKLRSIGDPVIDDLKNEEGANLEFTLKYDLIPEVEMPDWSKISVEKPILDISDKDVDEAIKELLGFSVIHDQESKTKAKKGDQVTLDAVGYVNEEAFEGGKLTSHKLVLGSGQFIPGFEDQLIGAKADDEVKVKVTFPETYHAKNLAGKDSIFECKVIAVHKASEPELNEEFAKKFGCETVDALKERVSEDIKSSFDKQLNVIVKRKLFDQLEEALKFEVPESLLTQEIAILKKQTNESDEDDEELKNKSEQEQEEYFTKLAARRVRLGLMLAEYSRINDIKISQEDIYSAILEQARSFPGYEQQIFEMYQKNKNLLEGLKGPILEEKAVKDILENHVKATEKKYTKDKLQKLIEKENE